VFNVVLTNVVMYFVVLYVNNFVIYYKVLIAVKERIVVHIRCVNGA